MSVRRQRLIVTRAWRVAWYRFRTTLARRWSGLLAIVVLIGVVGGLGIGAVAGARRTQSAFPAYLERSHASDLQVGIIPRSATAAEAYSPSLTATLAHLPHVRRVGAFPFIFARPAEGRRSADVPGRAEQQRGLDDRDASTASTSVRIASRSCRGAWRIRHAPTSS